MSLITKFVKDESGASAAEYILILAIIGGGIAAAAVTLGGNMSDSLTKAGSFITAKSNVFS